jgi:NTE family protein
MAENGKGRLEGSRVQLVLGSGGARGVAHVGVIDVLEEEGCEITSVAGCSMGAVVGGIYAAGFHAPYREWLLGMTRARVYGLFDLTLDRQGFVKGERIFQVLKRFIDVPPIEAFRIPFTAVAADMEQRREVWFDRGDLYQALRASIAIPGIFTPVRHGHQVLVDGGVLNPLPINAVQRQGDSLLVAVNVNGRPSGARGGQAAEAREARLFRNLSQWLKAGVGLELSQRKSLPNPRPVTDLLLHSYYMTQERLVDLMLRMYPPDITVEIPRDISGIFDFHRSADLAEAGREACRKAITAYLDRTTA